MVTRQGHRLFVHCVSIMDCFRCRAIIYCLKGTIFSDRQGVLMITVDELVDYIKVNFSWVEHSVESVGDKSNPQLVDIRVEIKIGKHETWPVLVSVFENQVNLDSVFAPIGEVSAEEAFRYADEVTGFGIKATEFRYYVRHICWLDQLEVEHLGRYLIAVGNETSQIAKSIPGYNSSWVLR